MKKLVLILCAAFVIMSAFVSRDYKSGIHGSIDPVEGAKKIWAISGIDSVSAVPLGGKFALEVNAGVWKLFIEGAAPYKSAVMENVSVQENQITDVGVIKLTE